MNVAIFASAYYPHFGGVEEACRNLALEYQRRGHNAHIVTTRHPKDLPVHEKVDGVPVWRFAFEMPRSSPSGMLHFLSSFPGDVSRVNKLLKSLGTDIIHVQCVGPNGLYALAANQLTGLPLVVTTQGERTMDAGRLYQTSAAANWTLKNLLRRADYVTACSQQTLDDAKGFAGFSIDTKSNPVYNGIALDEFDLQSAPYVHPRPFILGIGRVVPQKGFDILIDAYAKLLLSQPQAPDLIIAGDGSERTALQTQIESLSLTTRMHMIGRADRPMAVSLFKGCTCFVLPSRHEPQGIVSLEAMACSKAVVAARVGGVPEIVSEGETGLLFEGGSPDSLCGALETILTNPDQAARFGKAGRARVEERFTWPVIADQYFDIYNKIARTQPLAKEATCKA